MLETRAQNCVGNFVLGTLRPQGVPRAIGATAAELRILQETMKYGKQSWVPIAQRAGATSPASSMRQKPQELCTRDFNEAFYELNIYGGFPRGSRIEKLVYTQWQLDFFLSVLIFA